MSKATQRAGVFTSRNLPLIRKTYATYIRPVLEYNSAVWSSTKKYLIERRYNKRGSMTIPSVLFRTN